MKGIITLCGSTKFRDEFLEANKWLTLGGWVVLMPGVFGNLERDKSVKELIKNRKAFLDDLHLQKINMSECILVIDADGYIGNSTKSEIAWAEIHDVGVYYLSTPDIIEELNNG